MILLFSCRVTPTLALAIAFGGTAQVIAGIVDLRRGSIFGRVRLLPHVDAIHSFLLPRGAACRQVLGRSVLFWLLLLAFLLLDGATLGIVPALLAGWEIFLVGLIAWYIATATLVNAVHGRKVLPPLA